MGLTVHYTLAWDSLDPQAARDVVGKLHQHALALPFERVSPLASHGIKHSGEESGAPPWLQFVCDLQAFDQDGCTVSPDRAYAFERLLSEVARWNEMIAGVVGQFKDDMPGAVEAEVFEHPNFEHLEARGRKGPPPELT